ncbi:5-(carboxyamino)imidazole ribonucleotide synthase [Salinibacterium sp. UTAS2018]|uniref:5-(carboxyamino)imidazole ribonucleotide synthase n=1 Tax=Salinibacterium sp. UTAS2018 TaxID=2508880 RepID=UPI0010095341|nr:5-(carboxyamino)imidazole ribonucleotide synthase [Salinibacterium sp. UTAS2018]QAV69999.1 5-(carboxyamino)imidazole ribonucleotide synthase [Salinibacterium sp. UTAS2018]
MSVKVGVIGGGQLARMMIPPAINLGIDIRVLAEAEGSPAALAATAVGDYHSVDEVLAFAREVDVVTFDHEHVPQEVLKAMVAEGIAVHPGPHALLFAQDKLQMRQRLEQLGLPMPAWAKVTTVADVASFLDAHDGVGVLKTPRGGYDGKGVKIVRAAADAADWLAAGELLIEELVDFSRELAQSVARNPSGDVALWPVVESIQRDSVCAEVTAPAPGVSSELADEAAAIARTIAEGLDVTGVLAVELFETTDGRIVINELAMRPHNTGHWSIDGCQTSQFEQHLRAVLDLPLGATDSREPWSVMVNILGGPVGQELHERIGAATLASPGTKIHDYSKQSRPGRKVGHVTASGSTLDDVRANARAAAAQFD